MNELYWITRLGGIHTLMYLITIICAIGIVALIIWKYNVDEFEYYGDTKVKNEKYPKIQKLTSIHIKYFSIAFILGVIGVIFVPTQKEAYLIYGVGNTIDYLKENKTAKQIPDKAIIALDRYLDSLNNDSIK